MSVLFGKWSSSSFRKRFPALVSTFLLYVGLNYETFLCLLFLSFLFCGWISSSINSTVFSKPLAFNASLYNGAAFWNSSSSDERLDILRPTDLFSLDVTLNNLKTEKFSPYRKPENMQTKFHPCLVKPLPGNSKADPKD